MRRDIVGAKQPHTLDERRHRHRDGTRHTTIGRVFAARGSDETLATCGTKDGITRLAEFIESSNQFIILINRFAEPKAGINHDGRPMNAGCDRCFCTLNKKRADIRNNIFICRGDGILMTVRITIRRLEPVHQNQPALPLCCERQHAVVLGTRSHVVDDIRTGVKSCTSHFITGGVDGDDDIAGGA